MTTRIERLTVELIAEGEKFKRELAKSQGSAEAWGRKVKAGISIGTAAIAGAAGAVAALTTRSIKLADEIAKNARAAGLSAETYQAWEFAASQAGVSQEKFSATMERATKRIGEAASGTGAAKKVLDQYGISVVDAAGKIRPTEEVLRDFADRMARMGTQAERSAASAAVLGREGVRLGQLFVQGSSGLSAFEQKARDLGLVIDEELLQQAEDANDQLDIMQRVINAQLIVAFKELIPWVTRASNQIQLFFGIGREAELRNEIEKTQASIERLESSIESDRDAGGFLSFVKKALNEGLITAIAFGDEIDNINQKFANESEKKLIAAKARLGDLYRELFDLAGKGPPTSTTTFSGLLAEQVNTGLADLQRLREQLGEGPAGKTFEELQAEAAQRAYARRFESLDEFSTAYLEKTQEIIDKELEQNQKRIEAEQAVAEAKITIAENVFAIGAAIAKEDSKAQRILLAAQKAAALVKSAIALQESIAKANAIGFPGNIPAIAQATAIGAQAIATIRGISVEGVAHSGLDRVPREGTYLLQRDERVVQPKQNQDLTRFLESQRAGGGGITVHYLEAPGSNTRKTFTQERAPDGQLLLMIREQIRSVVGSDLDSGRGVSFAFDRAMQRRGR